MRRDVSKKAGGRLHAVTATGKVDGHDIVVADIVPHDGTAFHKGKKRFRTSGS